MNKKRVDYDAIAATYNRRFANNQKRETAVKLNKIAQDLPAHQILEVGCGTGQWLGGLHEELAGSSASLSRFHGLDASMGMLAQAQARGLGLHLLHGQAETLPYSDQCFDLVFCVNAIHHFDKPGDFITESRRILRPGGMLAIVGMDPRGHQGNWYVYKYFEGTFETDLVRFPSWGTILDWVLISGFEYVSWQLIEHISDPKVGEAVFHDPFLEKDAVSQLALLSDDEYEMGLNRIRNELISARKNAETVLFQTEIFIQMLSARIPNIKWQKQQPLPG